VFVRPPAANHHARLDLMENAPTRTKLSHVGLHRRDIRSAQCARAGHAGSAYTGALKQAGDIQA